jgi:hypothetical protein
VTVLLPSRPTSNFLLASPQVRRSHRQRPDRRLLRLPRRSRVRQPGRAPRCQRRPSAASGAGNCWSGGEDVGSERHAGGAGVRG